MSQTSEMFISEFVDAQKVSYNDMDTHIRHWQVRLDKVFDITYCRCRAKI